MSTPEPMTKAELATLANHLGRWIDTQDRKPALVAFAVGLRKDVLMALGEAWAAEAADWTEGEVEVVLETGEPPRYACAACGYASDDPRGFTVEVGTGLMFCADTNACALRIDAAMEAAEAQAEQAEL